MENFRQLWFEDRLAVTINDIEDLAKFNSLYRFLLYKCKLNLKITYDYKIIAQALRISRPVYVMKNGTLRDVYYVKYNKYIVCTIDEFVNIFKSEQLIYKLENLLNEIEENEENKDNN
jgi:hypothetical protein